MSRSSVALVGYALGAAALVGCVENSKTPTIPEAKAQFYWEDVPLPKGFERDRQKSTEHRGEGKRWLKHFYIGPDSAQLVSNFYRQKMPEYAWELDKQSLQNGVEYLNYHKGGEKCEIRIEEIPRKFLGTNTQVYIVIGDGAG